MSYQFEWDKNKAASNQSKHQVSFEEAVSVFRDPLACIFDDLWHSQGEAREILIGHSANNRLLLVRFVERQGAIRIISARQATKKERKDSMKNMPISGTFDQENDLLPEYEFDYQKARSNRFAAQMEQEPVIAILDPDVAQFFKSSESVNKILRVLIEAMPGVLKEK